MSRILQSNDKINIKRFIQAQPVAQYPNNLSSNRLIICCRKFVFYDVANGKMVTFSLYFIRFREKFFRIIAIIIMKKHFLINFFYYLYACVMLLKLFLQLRIQPGKSRMNNTFLENEFYFFRLLCFIDQYNPGGVNCLAKNTTKVHCCVCCTENIFIVNTLHQGMLHSKFVRSFIKLAFRDGNGDGQYFLFHATCSKRSMNTCNYYYSSSFQNELHLRRSYAKQ